MGMFINALRLSPTAAAVRQVENYTRPENKEKYEGKKKKTDGCVGLTTYFNILL